MIASSTCVTPGKSGQRVDDRIASERHREIRLPMSWPGVEELVDFTMRDDRWGERMEARISDLQQVAFAQPLDHVPGIERFVPGLVGIVVAVPAHVGLDGRNDRRQKPGKPSTGAVVVGGEV